MYSTTFNSRLFPIQAITLHALISSTRCALLITCPEDSSIELTCPIVTYDRRCKKFSR